MPLTMVKRLRSGWESLQIDRKRFFLMLKGSVPVAISLAIYQSTPVSEVFTSLGFLVAIIAVVTVNLLPRAKLIQMTFGICVSTAIAIPLAMLATWSGLQARYHTDPEGLHFYNSSQSAVTGVWLFFHIWLSNSIQARYHHLLIPTILYNIFMIVQFTSCSRFSTWAQCWDLIYLTVRCYYTGVAISFVSGILIYPVSCRSEIFEIQEKYLHSAQAVLSRSVSYLGKQRYDPTALPDTAELPSEGASAAQEGRALQEQMSGLKALYVKMHEEIPMAKREIAWGKLRAGDINAVSDLCRRILMPIGGMSHLPDLVQKAKNNAIGVENAHWQEATGTLIEPAQALISAINEGLEHSGLQLGIVHARLGRKDTESQGDMIRPGDPNFSAYLEGKLNEFSLGRLRSLSAWTSESDGVEKQGTASSQLNEVAPDHDINKMNAPKDHRQLNLVLYTHQMLYSTGVAVLELCTFSDNLHSEGVMSRNRLIVPSFRALRQWLHSIFDTTDAAIADDDRPSTKKEEGLVFGKSTRSTHNIDHLSPQNIYERFGVKIRRFQEFLKGPEFSFGLRSACATMSCAIIAYLEPTQDIFTHYRLIWSVIIAAIGANMSAGQSGVSYVLRILGSFAALIICYLVWYIANGNTAGVIVLMWFASFIQMYFLLRWPRYLIGWLVILITEVLSIGYLTQVNKIGVDAATAAGVIYYKPYAVCAMRVACVLWGTGVSIFWTYLPFPITARSLMRKHLATSMHLIANYNTVVHRTVRARLTHTEGDFKDPNSQAYALSRARRAMFNKIMVLNASVRHSLYLQKYEPTLGGKFPVAIYKDILSQASTLLDYMSLISYSTQIWSPLGPHTQYYHPSARAAQWMKDLARHIEPANESARKIASILYQVSGAMSTGRQLPNLPEPARPYELWRTLQEYDPQILDARHVPELGYSTYAVVEVLSGVIACKTNELVRSIEQLVGVTTFDIDDDEVVLK